MATIESPPNSVWPNGLQIDSEGYVNFHLLGTNKVDISTITWPEGTKVISPFVYQNDKLVGFVDTKALEIDNNDTTIDINYTHFDADLDSIMENTLNINAPENATVNVKYGAVDKVLTEKIEKFIGKEKYEVKFDKNNNKASISLALDTTEEQIAAVEQLLGRVLPQNLVTEMEWADGLPISYTHVEYLETNNTNNAQFIATGIIPTSDTSCKMRMMSIETSLIHVMFAWATIPNKFAMLWGSSSGLYQVLYLNGQATTWRDSTPPAKQYEWRTFENRKNELWINNVLRKTLNPESFACDTQLYLFVGNSNVPTGRGLNRCSGFECWNDEGALANYIPALDPTGAPCFYDTVSKSPYYNSGAGDFLYPGAEQAVQTTDLETKSYAKLTEHGIRRLYYVPRGYTGTMDDYAAVNGFKELVEPPMPLEGYWIPEWRETETQLICNWVETEPPVEEVETLNNKN